MLGVKVDVACWRHKSLLLRQRVKVGNVVGDVSLMFFPMFFPQQYLTHVGKHFPEYLSGFIST